MMKARYDPLELNCYACFERYTLEHIMPKNGKNNWEPCDSEEEARNRDSKLLTLGNLAIITQSLNASIRDAAWAVKKTGKGAKPGLDICASGLVTLHDALSLDEWNEESISQRADWLYQKAEEIWSFGDLPEGNGSSKYKILAPQNLRTTHLRYRNQISWTKGSKKSRR